MKNHHYTFIEMLNIIFRRLFQISNIKFHVVGLKCSHCGAYNTCRTEKKVAPPKSADAGSSNSEQNGENGNFEAISPSIT